MIPVSRTMDADVLVVGGGIGGAMAAISAAEAGAGKVVVAEKCNVRRSGSGATGNDHFTCYIPEIHGEDLEPVLQEFLRGIVGAHKDPRMMRLHLQESFDIVRKWEEWGINMRPLGRYNFEGHALPGRPRLFLKFDGRKQKQALWEQMKKHGVSVLNHHPVVELTTAGGRIAGALALNMERDEPSFTLIRAKSVVLATGLTHRIYASTPTPASLFNTGHCPNDAGGQALGWRVGARMVNMELPYTHAGPKYFQRCGKATWLGVYRYPDGRPLGPFVTTSNREYGDVTADIWNTAFTELSLNGTGPAYIDCTDASPDDLAYMRKAMLDEGLGALLDYMAAEGVDLARQRVEFMRYEPILHGRGLDVDEDGQTSVPGLYAAGDMVGNAGCGIGLAAWLGWRSGRAAARAGDGAAEPEPRLELRMKRRMELLSAMYEREDGARWQEANYGLQQVMGDYAPAGPFRKRSATMLDAGLAYLDLLRKKAETDIKAANSHELMRAAEVLDLFDCAEAILHAARERRESREFHTRSDYTFTNPLLADKMLLVSRGENGISVEWRSQLL